MVAKFGPTDEQKEDQMREVVEVFDTEKNKIVFITKGDLAKRENIGRFEPISTKKAKGGMVDKKSKPTKKTKKAGRLAMRGYGIARK